MGGGFGGGGRMGGGFHGGGFHGDFAGRGFGGYRNYARGYGWGFPYYDDWDYGDYYGNSCYTHLVPYHGHYVYRYYCS
jgi:hypothetical protein